MANNNKNPRRTIWLSETEPLSHYDIWLSKNQHLNSDGDSISDSGVLRPCDYIFKVWDCDNWYPIIGLNSTALNKINTVKNLGYTSIYNGEEINSFSYLEFHLPLFTKPTSSPSELFDAGTLGLAIKKYVTNIEWLQIFEGNNIDINTFIDPAEADKLGGIYANEFLLTDIFPDSIVTPFPYEINNSYNWIALAKYKLGYNASRPEDYNLYVSAKDIIKIVTQYQEDNPDEPGITPGSGAIINSGVLYNSFYNSPTILKGWLEDFNNSSAWKPRFELAGARLQENRGKFLKLTDNELWWETHSADYNETNNALEWVSIDEIYPVLSSEDNVADKKYVINGGGKEGTYLNWLGEWTKPSENEYSAIYPVGINHLTNEISILPYQGNNRKLYLCSENNNVSWQPVDAGLTYDVLSREDHFDDKLYVVNGCGNISPDKVFLNGNGEWAEPYGNTTYTEGIGITINNENNTHSINIDTEGADEGLVLSYNGSGGVEWISIPNSTIHGTSINCNNGDVTINNLQITSNNNITITIDNEQPNTRSTYNLNTWNYYNLSNCKTLSITSVPNTMLPIYIRIIEAPYGIICNSDKIDIGSVLTDTLSKDILVTLQFGIAKFEEISASSQLSEPSEP